MVLKIIYLLQKFRKEFAGGNKFDEPVSVVFL